MARISASGSGGSGGSPLADSVYIYNEVTNVVPAVETTIATYTASGTAYLQQVKVSGTNMAEYRIYKNGSVIDKVYSSLTEFNDSVNYFTGNDTAPGIKLMASDLIEIKGIQNRPSTCSFNAVIQILEVI